MDTEKKDAKKDRQSSHRKFSIFAWPVMEATHHVDYALLKDQAREIMIKNKNKNKQK